MDEGLDKIFAPWRMEWVKRDRGDYDGCVFCHLADSTDDAEHRVLARTEHSFAVLNNAPYNPGHTLVIPNDHTGSYLELDADVVRDIHLLVQTTIRALKTSLHPDGYNVGMSIGKAGGASIEDHIHVHVIPRWERDTTFLPTTANTKVVVEALDETYTKVRTALRELEETDTGDDAGAVVVET